MVLFHSQRGCWCPNPTSIYRRKAERYMMPMHTRQCHDEDPRVSCGLLLWLGAQKDCGECEGIKDLLVCSTYSSVAETGVFLINEK